jgi:hypothetical protein
VLGGDKRVHRHACFTNHNRETARSPVFFYMNEKKKKNEERQCGTFSSLAFLPNLLASIVFVLELPTSLF